MLLVRLTAGQREGGPLPADRCPWRGQNRQHFGLSAHGRDITMSRRGCAPGSARALPSCSCDHGIVTIKGERAACVVFDALRADGV